MRSRRPRGMIDESLNVALFRRIAERYETDERRSSAVVLGFVDRSMSNVVRAALVGSVQERSLMRFDERPTPPAPGKVPAGRVKNETA